MSFETSISKMTYSAPFQKVMKLYKQHIVQCIDNSQPVTPLEKFYWQKKKEKVCSSKIIEGYFRKLHTK